MGFAPTGRKRLFTAHEKCGLAVLVELADAEKHGLHVSMSALNALDYLDDRAAPALERILALPQELPGMDRRFRIYLPNLIAKIRSDFE